MFIEPFPVVCELQIRLNINSLLGNSELLIEGFGNSLTIYPDEILSICGCISLVVIKLTATP